MLGGIRRANGSQVLTGSFVIRIVSLLKAGVYPAAFGEELSSKAPNFYRWAQEVARHPSVTSIYNEDYILKFTKDRLASNRSS